MGRARTCHSFGEAGTAFVVRLAHMTGDELFTSPAALWTRLPKPPRIEIATGGRLARRAPAAGGYDWDDFGMIAEGCERPLAGQTETGERRIRDPEVLAASAGRMS